VQQGINRVVWELDRDGIRDMPGPEEQDYEDGLPGGPEVPPGRYTVSLSLDGPDDSTAEVSAEVTTLIDPRSTYTQAEIEQNHATRLQVQAMREAAVVAVERIVAARDDVATIKALTGKRPEAEDDETLIALTERAGEITETLDELEKLFRTPPETRGITYDDDKVSNLIGLADKFVASTYGVPGSAADTYIDIARTSLQSGTSALNDFIAGDLADFRVSVDAAGIGLLSDAGPVN